RFLRDERLETIDRGSTDVEQLARARFAEPPDARGRIELESGEHLPAVPRARAPADLLALQDDDVCARPREMTCGGQARVAATDDCNIDALGQDLGRVTCDL